MEWNEFLDSASTLLNKLSLEDNRSINDYIDLKLPTYYFIFDCIDSQIITSSNEMSSVLGYKAEDFNIELFFNKIHPEDKDTFIKHEHLALEFCLSLNIEQQKHYKIIHDFRIMKQNGEYIRVLQQTGAYEINDSAVLKTIIQHIDITNVKGNELMELHFIGLHGQPSYYNIEDKADIQKQAAIKFTKRELIILRLLDQGKTSEHIANELFISIHTVRTHRKNILQKAGCENTIDLLKMVKKLKLL